MWRVCRILGLSNDMMISIDPNILQLLSGSPVCTCRSTMRTVQIRLRPRGFWVACVCNGVCMLLVLVGL